MGMVLAIPVAVALSSRPDRILGLQFTGAPRFALVFCTNGTMLKLAKGGKYNS